MAVNDLYLVKVFWNDIRTEMSSTIYYKQTVQNGTAELAPFNLANAWWDNLVGAVNGFQTILADDCNINAVWANQVPASGAANNQASGKINKDKVAGTRVGQPLPGAAALKVQLRAIFGIPEKVITNYFSVSGIAETDQVNGAWAAAYLNPVVSDFVTLLLANLVDVPSGDEFNIQVARDPRGPARDFKDPLNTIVSSRVLNQRKRYSERWGSA